MEEKVINRIKPRDISKDVELLKNHLTDNQLASKKIHLILDIKQGG